MNILLTGADGFLGRHIARALGGCRTWNVESENRPQRGQFLPDLQPHSPAMGQKDGEKWTAAADLQPTISKSDRLPGSAGHQARPVSRRHGMDFSRMQAEADWTALLRGVDAVINCVGIIAETRTQKFAALHTQAPIALFRACAAAKLRKVVQISALGSDGTAFSAYHLSKRAADDCLRSLDVDGFVLRPSLVYGPGGQSAALFMRVAAWPLIPVLGDGLQMLQPVHVSDVVAAVLRCLDPDATPQTLDIVGPQCMAFAEWLQTMRLAQGKPRTGLLPVPFSLALAASYGLRYVLPMAQPENLQMLKKGYWADPNPLVAFLGRAPLPVRPALFFSDVALPCDPQGAPS